MDSYLCCKVFLFLKKNMSRFIIFKSLINRTQTKEEDGLSKKEQFCQYIHEYEKSMYILAKGIVKNDADVADVIQDSILKAYTNFDTLKDKNKFKPWIMRIVHNTAIDFIKKQREILNSEAQEQVSMPEPSIDKETKLTIWEAVQKLNFPYQTVIILYYYDGYSAEKISEITSTSVVNVRQQLSRGRKKLANLLNEEDFIQ